MRFAFRASHSRSKPSPRLSVSAVKLFLSIRVNWRVLPCVGRILRVLRAPAARPLESAATAALEGRPCQNPPCTERSEGRLFQHPQRSGALQVRFPQNPPRPERSKAVLLKILHVRNVRRPSFSESAAFRRSPSAVSAKSSTSGTLGGCLLQNPPRAERSEPVFFKILHVRTAGRWRILSFPAAGAPFD